jgi:hypothetical protein
MSYQAEISRASPTAILVVMDQSTSMNHRLKSGQTFADLRNAPHVLAPGLEIVLGRKCRRTGSY